MKLLLFILSALMYSCVYARRCHRPIIYESGEVPLHPSNPCYRRPNDPCYKPPADPNLWKYELYEKCTEELNYKTCPYIALIYAHDPDGEPGNVGDSGKALWNELKKSEKKAPLRNNESPRPYIKMQGVNYAQVVAAKKNGTRWYMPQHIPHPDAVRRTKNLITYVDQRCHGRTNIVLAGFMRGVDVLRNVTHSLTDSEKHEIVSLIAMSDSKFTSKFPVSERFATLETTKVVEQCDKHDLFCHHSNIDVDALDEVYTLGEYHGYKYEHHWSKQARDHIFQGITELRGDEDCWVNMADGREDC
ncbi:hypothetical protein MBLNU457_3912t2 [Dothideomycetes sp. NU457]